MSWKQFLADGFDAASIGRHRGRSLRAVSALVLVASLGLAAGAQAEVPYDVLSYRLAVSIDFEKSPPPGNAWRSLFSVLNHLSAEATIRTRNVSEQPQEEISLILNRLMSVSEIRSGGRVLSFDLRLTALEDNERFHVQHLTVRWGEPLAAGAEGTLSIRYGGQLIGYPEVGMLYVRETLDPDFTILRYETFSYPQVSPPVEEEIRSVRRRDRFDQELEISVPTGHVAVSGGRATGVREADGKTMFSFASHEPDGIIMVPIAPYEVATSGPHRIFHFTDSAEGVKVLTGNLEQVMALFTNWFGPSGLERGLTIAQIPEFFGSQAGALILQTSGAFTRPEQYGEFYHELSHLWNPRDVDEKPSRWNEGLAMFLQGMAEESLADENNLEYLLSDIFTRLKGRLEKSEKLATVAMIDYGREDMTGYSYSTGALFFALLRERAGEEALLQFLGEYFRAHREAGSTDRGLAEAIVENLGEATDEIVREWFLTADWVAKLTAAESWDQLKEGYLRSPDYKTGIAGHSQGR